MAVGGFVGFRTLLYKEVLRFWKVAFQTVAAPVLTAVLYLLIFGHVLEDRVRVYDQISYTAFLVPGLVMMSVLQNAFANSSSSLIQSKITGNLVFIMLPPLSHWEMYRRLRGGVGRAWAERGSGRAAGDGVVREPACVTTSCWILVFALAGAGILGTLGLVAGIWAEKFDQLAAFQNFLIMPATFLSGVFYSIHSLPPFWRAVSHAEPVLLHDRRLPLRLLRRVGRAAAAEPGRGGRVVRRAGRCWRCGCSAPATSCATDATPHAIDTNSPRDRHAAYTRNKSGNTLPKACPATIWKWKATASTSSPPSSAPRSTASA